jgi:hypothetical protein
MRPYKVKESDYSTQPDDHFDGVISSSSETLFQALATRFASLSLGYGKASKLHITAAKGNIYSLNNPNNLFDEIVFGKEAGEDMQCWFESCKRRKTEPRFVVAYRTFVDAQLSRDKSSTTDISGKVSAPISTLQGDLSGAADFETQAARKTNMDMKGDMKTPGERIYAICYRKINISHHKGKVIPSLIQANTWKPFAKPRGETDVKDEYVQADLLGEDDAEDCEIREMKTADGGTLFFGIRSESAAEDGDEEDEW